MVFAFGMPKMVKASAKHIGQGRKRTDVSAQIAAVWRVVLVGLNDHGHGIPTHVGAQPLLYFQITGAAGFLVRLNGVDITRGGRKRHVYAVFSRMLQELLYQEMGAFRPLLLNDRA